MNYTHFVSVAALVMNEENQVLLIKSPDRGWEYPGGMVEPHETIQEALLREIREETGVEASIVGFIGISKNIERDIVNIDFICKYVAGKLETSPESLEVKWVSKKDALEMVEYPITKKRLSIMLSSNPQMYCLGFAKTPFQIIREEYFDTGLQE